MKLSLHLLICLVFILSISIYAQSETEKGVELYRNGDYKKALDVLKRATKAEANNAQAWYFLGLAQMNENKLGDAEKSLKKSISLNSGNSLFHSALALVYLMRNNSENANTEAQTSLTLDKQNAVAYYVLGAIFFRNGAYNRSYEYAKKTIGLNPSYASGYLLKAESLISSFIQQSGTVLPPTNYRSELLKEAGDDLEKYVTLSLKNKDISFYQNYLESIRFFAEYYSKTGEANSDSAERQEPNTTALKILSKPRASYTDSARAAGVKGTITLLINFSADGTTKDILVIRSLGFGLDQEAIRAAKKIKFNPQMKDSKPISVVKMVQYTFTLY